MLAVESILVQIIGRTVGVCDNRYLCLNQAGEQPRHDHRISTVVHHHLVKGEKACFAGQSGGDRKYGIAQFLLAFLPDSRVDIQHEFVEMGALLAIDGEIIVE